MQGVNLDQRDGGEGMTESCTSEGVKSARQMTIEWRAADGWMWRRDKYWEKVNRVERQRVGF